MSTETKAVVRRLYEEVWNKRRLEVASEVLSPSHALHDPHLTGSAVGPEAYKRVCTQFIAAFPDLQFTVEDYISEKDKVVASWTHFRHAQEGVPRNSRDQQEDLGRRDHHQSRRQRENHGFLR